jgi:iron complex transport system ATP-binding protein
MSFTLHDISLAMGNKTLVSNINLSVNPKEVLAILGPNGAGKSTVFKVMAGEYRHYQGGMTLNGATFGEVSPNQRAQMIGVLPQASSLDFAFNVYEVVLLGRLPHSTGKVRDREIVYAAMEKADVAHLAQALYTSLSGGEKQRVQLARVLCQIWEPSVFGSRYLLLDEPTSALDLSHQHHTLALARALAGEGVGVLSILHDLNLAAQYADKILLLGQGKVVNQGSVKEILTQQQISSLYNIDVSVIPHPKHDHPLIVTS